MLKTGLRLAIGLIPIALLLQLVHPELSNPPVTAELQAPAAVKQILRTSCYACHSNETRLSRFDRIVPAYQLVAHDVKQARSRLNFSELGAQPIARQRAVLFEAINRIQMGVMPLPRYARLHREAEVSPTQLAVLRDYLLPATPAPRPAQIDINAADLQYQQWTAGGRRSGPVRDAPNGIAFMPDYRDWKMISSTNRVDSNTFRMILGNDVAIQALTGHHINPWPDGTTFAKVAWRQKPGENGDVQTGAFFQVAFMIKNRKKYASTAGWGWAQWVGAELKPYGDGPGFASDCVACHAPLTGNDYVFTLPIRSVGAQR